MKMSLSVKIIVFFSVLFAICTGFTIYAAFMFAEIALTITTVMFGILVIILFAVFVLTLKKHIQFVLSQLSEVISSLIDMRENEVFSVLNDDMLSKLQSQVIKLSGILKAQNSRLKNERDEIKSLISDISHQLKTPLANLRVYCDLLLDASLPLTRREEFTQNMQKQLEKLSFLLESMIKMSRLESGIIQLSPESGSLNETCLSAIRQIYQKAQTKNIRINFDSGQDILLKHDRNWTTEAIFNILDNAIKYTESNGSVTISIEKYELFAKVNITDTGSGLEEAEINKIFRRFYRGENARKQEGVGIGLYLSREIIQKQGGYIKVQSNKDKGSTFSLLLPLN
jgi:Osmosensitive K+ channel histidine kinase